MPARVCPQFTADGRVGDHEADRIGNLVGTNQTAKLRVRQDVLVQEVFSQRSRHWRVGESRMNDPAADAVEDRLFRQRRSRTLQSRFGDGIRDLAFVALRRNRSQEDHHSLNRFFGFPTLESALFRSSAMRATISMPQ